VSVAPSAASVRKIAVRWEEVEMKGGEAGVERALRRRRVCL
jgi:hypothetical protein